jgi:predicted ATP-grasp superfamily ATP-dependent carboligase
VFLADGRRALALALSRQIVGERAFGASGFRYCGSLIGGGLFEAEEALLGRASAMAEAVTRDFGLVGLNGIDFIARAGVPWPIEVNPRYSASMELLERHGETPLFALHAGACSGRLPEAPPHPARGVLGKAVVFARRDVALGETRGWLRDPAIADVPHPGERIPRGRPICTVFATGRNAGACLRALVSKAGAIYRAAEPGARGAA